MGSNKVLYIVLSATLATLLTLGTTAWKGTATQREVDSIKVESNKATEDRLVLYNRLIAVETRELARDEFQRDIKAQLTQIHAELIAQRLLLVQRLGPTRSLLPNGS